MELNISYAYAENDKLLFSAWNVNGFFSCDIRTGVSKLLTLLPEFQGKYGYSDICLYKNYIYLSPCNGTGIVRLENNNWQSQEVYTLDDKQLGCNCARYGGIFKNQDSLYFRPYSARAVLSFNTVSHEIRYYDECYRLLENVAGIKSGPLFAGNAETEGKIWFVCLQANMIFSFDMMNQRTEGFEIANENERFTNVYSDGKYFWIICRSGSIIKWNKAEGIVHIFKDIWLENARGITACICDNRIWLATVGMGQCVSISLNDNIVRKEGFKGKSDDSEQHGNLRVINGEIYYLPEHNRYLYKFNDKECSAKAVLPRLEGEEYKCYKSELMNRDIQYGRTVREGTLFSVDMFLDNVLIG